MSGLFRKGLALRLAQREVVLECQGGVYLSKSHPPPLAAAWQGGEGL
jgi:hypothetical protein